MHRDVPPAVAGAVAAGMSLGVGELVGGLLPGAPSLILSVGALLIDLQPPGAKDIAVALFGEADKIALNILIVLVALALGAAGGVAASRRIEIAAAGFTLFGLVGLYAALQEPLVDGLLALVVAILAIVAGLLTLRFLLGRAQPAAARMPENRPTRAQVDDRGRRRFLVASVGTASAAVLAGGLGRFLLEARNASAPAARIAVPPPGEPLASLPAAASFDVAGLTPIVVPNEDFYRIDVNLLIPRLEVETWRLRIHGMVDREVELTYDDLLAMPIFEQHVTIACVSNEVGGDLVGNARWGGVRLREILELAGVRDGATQIAPRAFDGWTAGFPTEYALSDERECMLALTMNGEPLPAAHGYPARLIVPGLYGYVSATKWITDIELTTWEAFDSYWVPLGWAKEGPILTQSRIDVPRGGRQLARGPVTIAGVAWAPDRGISRVEVAVDGAWREAEMSRPISDATWVQWRTEWQAEPGRHTLAVRATDGTGETQTDRRSDPAPDGARGHHTITVSVA